jgi:DNA-nicking Smr family endonuclease
MRARARSTAARGRSTPLVPLDLAGPPATPPEPHPALHRQHEQYRLDRWGEQYTLLAPGTDRRMDRDLRAGDQPPDASLDLHGLDSARARQALRGFVEAAHQRGCRRLLVIHGRGHRSGPAGPVLRECMLEALASPPLGPRVLAVVDASPALGGS